MDLDLALAALSGTNSAVEAFASARDRSDAGAPWVAHTGFVEHHKDGRLVLRGTFAGRYVDADEELHMSEHGRDVGLAVGAAIGFLLGPLGFAEGVVWGPQIGSQLGKPDEVDPEPALLVERLREAVPPSSSAIVLIAAAHEVDEFLAVLDQGRATVIRRHLAPDDVAALEASLSSWPVASSGPSRKGEQAVEEAGGELR